tara:strand:- start:3418 stop:4395 length:978 start_codon:yes stop_codon:yes gene_type:complete
MFLKNNINNLKNNLKTKLKTKLNIFEDSFYFDINYDFLIKNISLPVNQFNKSDINFLIKFKGKGHGFFSNFTHVILNLHIANLYNFNPVIIFERNQSHYSEDSKIKGSYNYWDYYFIQDNFINKNSNLYINSDINFPKKLFDNLYKNSEYFSKLIKKYILIRPEIHEIVNEFIYKNFKNKYTIGLHWRGTDIRKAQRSNFVKNGNPGVTSLETISNYLDKSLAKHPNAFIFISTDEEANIDLLTSRYGKEKILFTNCLRSKDNSPIHLNYKNSRKLHNYYLGLEVLIDCMLLSSCNYLLGKRSNVFNAALLIGEFQENKFSIIPD